MERDIYQIARELQEHYGRYYALTFENWSRPLLERFDEEEVGTHYELTRRRKGYEKQLEEEHRLDYVPRLREKQADVMKQFEEALAAEFFDHPDVKIPDVVKARVYGYAWDRGHSGGLTDIVLEYHDLAEMVLRSILDYLRETYIKRYVIVDTEEGR